MVDNLEKLNMVKRVGSPTDRRKNLIYITDQAKKLQDQTMDIAAVTMNEALDGVSRADIERAKSVLQKIYDNLTS